MAEIINLYDYKHGRQKHRDDEIEQKRYEHAMQCEALFVIQHSDDDRLENNGEFVFVAKKDS